LWYFIPALSKPKTYSKNWEESHQHRKEAHQSSSSSSAEKVKTQILSSPRCFQTTVNLPVKKKKKKRKE